jgi:hypothetical protein
MNNVSVYGKEIKVSTSKYDSIQSSAHKSDGASDDLMKEFDVRDLKVQRYAQKRGNTFNRNQVPPSNTLFVAGLYKTDKEQIEEFFGKFARDVKVEMGSDNWTCWIELPSLDEAFDVLCEMHNKELNGHSIRISFAARRIRSSSDTRGKKRSRETDQEDSEALNKVSHKESRKDHSPHDRPEANEKVPEHVEHKFYRELEESDDEQ